MSNYVELDDARLQASSGHLDDIDVLGLLEFADLCAFDPEARAEAIALADLAIKDSVPATPAEPKGILFGAPPIVDGSNNPSLFGSYLDSDDRLFGESD